ncbi:class I SAM-dependent methyltransferase [Weeksella virosa]|uniref:Methyltransferase type 11 n=1 Tax=Weeksella virosa (strain ATCC 43766 / DSM 16922 / JCM 21250 / CCUG 30538 / CDC 9751 / IAM 14551 / NBRC 16016 / NCTC 11634 / CL345/78) TaxID=865938 RepID=F0P0I7_WEEVC|nr:class I SAM-dependent methyltransferase [Weeksella virosa]ADX68486.1 Methyltransferase type 11 [Weeksella virosa DSM 16922]VEH63857.1 cyclopropane fatty acyl phospholipid synthase [Weeksella virosa]
MLDLFGQAIKDYYEHKSKGMLRTETNISEMDDFPMEILFRSYEQMNKLEQKALELAYGKVADIGCGTGSHSLYLQNERHLDVTAIDISRNATEVAKNRGVRKVICMDYMELSNEVFDTILLMMNGSGLFRSLDAIDFHLQKLHQLLSPEGSIFLDSTDILYMYNQDLGNEYELPFSKKYYGEVEFTVHYGNQKENFPWLYLDKNTLENAAYNNYFYSEVILEDEFSFLAKLTKI